MPQRNIQRQTSIAANTTTNIMTGEEFEFLDSDCLIAFGIVAEAAGLLVSIFLTDRLITRDFRLTVVAANVMPVRPDNFPMTGVMAAAGERVVIRVQNTTAGAINVNWYFGCD